MAPLSSTVVQRTHHTQTYHLHGHMGEKERMNERNKERGKQNEEGRK
jgi:hypothetical protein